jgi:serine/threonine protein kinase
VAEYCENGDLSKHNLSDKTLRQRLLLYRGICDAVGATHRAGITHRDLKPSNVLIRSNGAAVVGDLVSAFIWQTRGSASPPPPRQSELETTLHLSLNMDRWT